jgi:5-hydroxyisourate hydrolase-like protein (transthyretin family)
VNFSSLKIDSRLAIVELASLQGAMMKKVITVLPYLFLLAATNQAAQSATEKRSATTSVKKEAEQKRESQPKERRGPISGRVVTESGEPLAHISVRIIAVGSRGQANQRAVGTDEDGRFQADDLSAATYVVSTYAPGYVFSNRASEPRYYRIGDSLTVTMTKGGVITGLVKTAAGEPVINVSVRAIRVKDADGKPLRNANARYERITDDRGSYRMYGMEAGAYVIAAGSRGAYNSGYDKYSEDLPTYHPSSTRDAANEVIVTTGQEISGIDIIYRGEKGHAVSGTVANHPGLGTDANVAVTLINAATGIAEAGAPVNFRSGNRGFEFFGVADGDYFVKAQYSAFNMEQDAMASGPKRITVKAGDVTGVELQLAPLASISGRLVFEPLATEAARKKCEGQKAASLEEVLLSLRRDHKGETLPPGFFNQAMQFSADDKREFALYRFEAGLYRLSANLPSPNWYLKSIGFADGAKPGQPAARNVQLSDVAGRGLQVKPGERVRDLTVTISEGAASLSGKVAAEGAALPQNLRLYLVPAERERASDALRFAYASMQIDGTFSLTGIAPGKYWMLAQAIGDEELAAVAPRHPVWDAEGRSALRKAAEAANQVMELQTCQHIVDYSWRYVPQTPASKAAAQKTQ